MTQGLFHLLVWVVVFGKHTRFLRVTLLRTVSRPIRPMFRPRRANENIPALFALGYRQR